MVRCNMTPEEQEQAQALFPPAPSTRELERSRNYFERYLFYETWGLRNFREYFCPFCGRFEIEGPWKKDIYSDDPFSYHHRDRAPCPMCGNEYTLICLGKAGKMKSLISWGKIAFMRSACGVLTISAGEAVMEYDREDLCPLPRYLEKARYVVAPGKRQMWKRDDWYMRNARSKWVPTKTFYEPYPRTHWFGIGEMRGEVGFVGAENIRDTSMRYCQLEDYLAIAFGQGIRDDMDDSPFRGAIRYLGEYSVHPQIEMLVKLGHEDVVTDLLERGSLPRELVNWRANTPAAFFRMTKAEYRMFTAAGGEWKALKRMKKDAPAGVPFAEYMAMCARLPKTATQFFARCKVLGADARKSFDYLRDQSNRAVTAMDETAQIWLDYLDMAGRLERNMTFRRNVYPDHLQDEHDAAVKQVAYVEQLEGKKPYGKRYKRLRKRYEYAAGGLRIVVPKSAQEIVREGKVLQHCVGGYADRHIKGMTTILFLRREDAPDDPYVTVEISDAKLRIRQAHGYRNEADGAERPLERHREFFDEWLAWLQRGSPRTKKGQPIRTNKTEMEDKTA